MQPSSDMAHNVLFKNIQIFDLKTAQLAGPANVLVRGNIIERISTAPIHGEPDDTEVIDGRGRTLMPGLIDMHWHTMFVRPAHTELLAMDMGYANLLAGAEAGETLMRGFTTVRDLGGPSFGRSRIRRKTSW